MRSSADVLVIGGGIIGTSIAYQLAKRGVQVTLVEKGDLASGTSSACADGVQMATKTIGPKLAIALDSLKLYRGLCEELGCDVGFRQDGGMIVAQTESEEQFVIDRVEKLKAAGLEIDYLRNRETRALMPALSPNILGASYCPSDSLVDPIKVTMGFARVAQRLGAQIQPFTTVVDLKVDDGRLATVVTSAGNIAAEKVVNSAGVWAPEIARLVGVDLPIVPRRGQIFITEPVPPLLKGKILSASYMMSKKMPAAGEPGASQMLAGVVAGQHEGGHCIIGSTREFVGFDKRTNYEGIAELIRQTGVLIPALRNVHVIRSFAGLRPACPDGLPILGYVPGLPWFITAAGHEGDGIALSPITGLKIAQLITGEIQDQDLAPFSLQRFSANQ